MVNKFENLEAWKQAKDLAVLIYKLTSNFPQKEKFALTDQILRAAVSISANIAEGCSRSSKKDFSHFLEISVGSGYELKTLIEIAFSVGYLSKEDNFLIQTRIESVLKLTLGLKRKLNNE